MKSNYPACKLFLSAILTLCPVAGHTDNQKSFLDTLSSPEPKMKTNKVENPLPKSSAVSIIQKTLQIRDASGQIKLMTIFVPTFALPAVKEAIAKPPAPRSISSLLADKVRDLALLKKLKESRNVPSAENVVNTDSQPEQVIRRSQDSVTTDTQPEKVIRRSQEPAMEIKRE